MLGRSLTLVMLVAALLLATSAQAAHVSCGDRIVADIRLDDDLRDCSGDGLVIAASGITVNLAGHGIHGTGAGAGIRWDGAPGGDAPVIVRNGSVTGFEAGIQVDREEESSGWSTLKVRFLRLSRNVKAASCTFAECSFSDSRVVRNDEGLSYLFAGATLARNTFADNTSYAIAMSFTGASVRRNRIVRNGQGFGSSETSPTISDNVFADNRGSAINLTFTGGDGAITRNRILRNRSGITLDFQGGVDEISDNLIAGSERAGITIDEDATTPIRRNRIVANGGNGIEAIGHDYGVGEVTGNEISRNDGHGVQIGDAAPEPYDNGGGTLRGNVLRHNALDGIALFASGRAVIEGNWAERNGDDGIDVDPHDSRVRSVGWSPDGTRIAFVSAGLHVTNVDVSRSQQVAPAALEFAWSPDGGTLAFTEDRALKVVRPDGSGLATLVQGIPVRDVEWSPDGERLAFSGGFHNDIHMIDVDGSDLRQLTFFGTFESSPTWVAGGTALVFDSNAFGDFDLWRVQADGTGLEQHTDDPREESHPQGSPDGARIAYLRDSTLATIRADGIGASEVGPAWRSFAWSPGGDVLAFTDLESDLRTAAPDGTDQHLITPGPEGGFSPSWSPDGTRLAFAHQSEVGTNLGIARAESSSSQVFFPAWVRVAANRADRNADLGIEAVPGVDSGANRGRHNGDPRQCVGVVCR